jgi:flagellar basal-body rod modification protein FlgD
MSTASGINVVEYTPPTDSITRVGEAPSMGMDQLLQLMIAQMQNQDPLNPTSNEDTVLQLAQMSSIQGTSELNDSMQQLLTSNGLSSATSLIGKEVTYRDLNSGVDIYGTATSVKVVGADLYLNIGGNSVKMDQIISVKNPPPPSTTN